MTINTNRLVLRPLNPSDVESIVENLNNLEVSKWMMSIPFPYTSEDALSWINHCKEKASHIPLDFYAFGIQLKSENNIIGCISLTYLDNSSDVAEISYWIGSKYHKNGYGSETLKAILSFAFNQLKLRRIEAGIFSGNVSSAKLLEKFQFKYEGTKLQSRTCKADGIIKDELLYHLLKEDYNEMNS